MFFLQNVFKKLRRLRKKTFSRKSFQLSGNFRKAQAKGMEKLVFQMITVPVNPVDLLVAVLPVSHQRMALSRQMRPDLVCAPCMEPDLKKRHPSIIPQRLVFRLYRQRVPVFTFLFIYRYFITFCIFMQISFDIFFLF